MIDKESVEMCGFMPTNNYMQIKPCGFENHQVTYQGGEDVMVVLSHHPHRQSLEGEGRRMWSGSPLAFSSPLAKDYSNTRKMTNNPTCTHRFDSKPLETVSGIKE